MGNMHGDVAVASNGEVYVSVMDPKAALQVYGPDGKFLRNVPNAPADFHGFVIQKDSKRRQFLENWLQTELLPWCDGRILPVTMVIAERWGRLEGACQLKGTPLNTADGLIAATALQNGLTVVTRNVKHFAALGAPILNPWEM